MYFNTLNYFSNSMIKNKLTAGSKITFLMLVVLLLGCKEKNEKLVIDNKKAEVISEMNKPSFYVGKMPVYEKFEDFEPLLRIENDTTYVMNFWATWCKPCIEEMPYFKEMDSIHADKKLKLVFVSLDFPKQLETRLIPFAKNYNIESQVVVLLDGKQNDWIGKVSNQWSGAIPATYIYNRNKDLFHENAFKNTEELVDAIRPFLN